MSTALSNRKGSPSRFRRRAFARLRTLDCFENVERLIADRVPLPEIARFIQQERHEYTHVTRESLVVILGRFRRRSAPALTLVTPQFEAAARQAARRVVEDINVLVELESLYRDLHGRLDRIHETEIITGALNPEARRLVGAILDLLTLMHRVQMDLGLHRRKRV